MSGFLRPLATSAALAALALAALVTPPAAAQDTGTIQGVVRDANTQRPLANVQVFIAELGRGVLTGPEGRYQLVNIPAGDTQLRFQRIGHGTVTRSVSVSAGAVAQLDVELTPSAIALDEVVATGTGGQAVERRKLGNTIATISAAQLENAPITTFTEILQGREPGVAALPSGGLTGEGTRIRIRGTSSLSQSNTPLIYIDGIRMDNSGGLGVWTGGGGMPSRLDDLDPTAIERIEILKGAAAATLYGSEASGGVIQIFTKRGIAGEPRWEFQVEQGFLRYPDVYKPNAGFARSPEQAAAMSEVFGIPVQPFQVVEQRFINDYLGTGYTSNYAGSVTGGTTGMTYYVSGRYQFENGPVSSPFPERADDRNRRAQGTANLTIYPTDNLNIRVGSFYTENRLNTIHNNNNIFAPLTLAMFGKPELANCPSGAVAPRQCDGPGNPRGQGAFATANEGFNKGFAQDVQRFTGHLGANYTPAPELSWDIVFGVDAVSQLDNMFYPFGWNVDLFATQNVAGTRTIYSRNHRQLSVDNRMSWNTDLGPNFTSSLSIGAQGFLNRTEEAWSTGTDFPGPGFEVSGAGAVQNVTEQWLSEVSAGISVQEQIGFRDFAFLTLGARYDRHSAFGEAVGGQVYPKVSLSLVPSDLPGWNVPALSTFRVRGAFGRSGKQPGAFDQFTSFGPIRSGEGAGIAPDNLGSPDLKPEVATEWELGTELGMLNDRAALEFTYWDRAVDDVLVARQFPVSGGFRLTQLDNIGQLKARGVEMGLRGLLVATRDISVDAFVNAAYLWEEITSLGGAPPLKVGLAYPRYRNFIREGWAPGAFFGPRLAEVENPISLGGSCAAPSRAELESFFAEPRAIGAGWDVLVHNCDGDFMDNYLGKPLPDWSGAFGLDASFLRNFRLTTLFEYKTGNFHVHNLTDAFRTHNAGIGRNVRGAAEAEATLLNPASTPQERTDAALTYVRQYRALSPYDGLNEIKPADFVRWREMSLTYDVPATVAGRMGVRNLALTVSGRNLALWTKYDGIDPETNVYGAGVGNDVTGVGSLGENFGMGIDAFGVPLARRFSVAARVSF